MRPHRRLIKKAEHPRIDAFQIAVLEEALESPSRRSNQSILKEIFIGRTDAEDPILWPLDVKSHLIGKDPDARKD